jgi:ligand-binding SRPBCC domain-containing protein
MRHRFRTTQWLPYDIESVFVFFSDPSNLPKLFPDWQRARIEEMDLHPPSRSRGASLDAPAIAGRGTRITLSFRPTPLSPVRVTWVALIEDFHWDERFCDRQVAGPFLYWRHCHRVQAWQSEQTGEHGTLLIDTIEYELPFGKVGRLANSVAVRQILVKLFKHRQRKTLELLRELNAGVESLRECV